MRLSSDKPTRHGLCGLQAQVDVLPPADGAVDAVWLLDVLEHLADPVAALCEMWRVLSPAGRLVIRNQS